MHNVELQIFSSILKHLRTSLNITQKEFADKIGVTAAALSAYENNQKNPSIAVAKRISQSFHISIDWLCGLSEKMAIDEKPKNFSDVIQLLFLIEDSYLQIMPKAKFSITGKSKSALIFGDSEMGDFIEEWEKMKDLHEKQLIDEDVYNLWKEKILKDYKKNIDL